MMPMPSSGAAPAGAPGAAVPKTAATVSACGATAAAAPLSQAPPVPLSHPPPAQPAQGLISGEAAAGGASDGRRGATVKCAPGAGVTSACRTVETGWGVARSVAAGAAL